MTKGFLLMVLGSSAIVFAGTWLLIGDPSAGPTAIAGHAKVADQQQLQFSSCEEAVEKGLAPLYAGRPGYSSDLDPDGDGLACPPA